MNDMSIRGQEDNWLSFSPMAWLAEQAFGFARRTCLNGVQVNFPEGTGNGADRYARDCAGRPALPQPRLGESGARGAIPHQRQQSAQSHDVPVIHADCLSRHRPGRRAPGDSAAAFAPLRWLGEYAIFEPLRDKLGLTRARNVLTAGAMLSSDIIRFFRAIGIELRQFYGSTETFGTVHLRGDVRFETVGVIVPGVEIKIAENQEILIRTRSALQRLLQAARGDRRGAGCRGLVLHRRRGPHGREDRAT